MSMLLSTAASAQNLNPTVAVTRAYEGRLMEMHKPMRQMTVADSLTRFDLDFDYSVFENPYKGAYDFKPYALEMRPEAAASTSRRLYLKAGAGFQLRPSVDFVWEPQLKTSRFKMDIYASHHSYIGKYADISRSDDGKLKGSGSRWNGYDMYSNAGVDGQANLKKAILSFNADYLGIHTKGDMNYPGFYDKGALSTGYNAAQVSFEAKSDNMADSYLYYDVAMKYRGAAQGLGGLKADGPDGSAGHSATGMNDIDFNVTLGPVLSREHRIVADFGMGMTWYGGNLQTNVGTAYITPKYILERNRWRLSAGPKFSFNISDQDETTAMNTNKGIYIYPDVHIGFEAVRSYMNIYFKAEGGDYRNPYYDLKDRMHFLLPFAGMTNNSVMHADFALGLNGNICSRLRYDVSAGFRSFEAMPFDNVVEMSGVREKSHILRWDYEKGTAVYSDIKLQWESRNFLIDSRFSFNDVKLNNEKSVTYKCFTPAKFSGFLSGTYNWRKRIFAGISAEFASCRDGNMTTVLTDVNGGENTVGPVVSVDRTRIPAWVNLGVYAEYSFTRKMSFWVRGENLLDMDIQRTPLYTDGGIGFTAGICLNL